MVQAVFREGTQSRAIGCFAALTANQAALKQLVRDPVPVPVG
jgi:hypothetical protein